MYVRNCTSKNQKVTYYMVNTNITGTSVTGLPRCGGPACQLSKEN
jgi:hypothetical protein